MGAVPKLYSELSYMPNTQGKPRCAGRPLTRLYLHQIAVAQTARGVDDDEPVLLFLGAPFELLRDACGNLFRMMDGRVRNLVISREHSCSSRNGKHYWRLAVRIVGLDEQFISLSEFVFLLVSHIRRICNCTVRHYREAVFLNL